MKRSIFLFMLAAALLCAGVLQVEATTILTYTDRGWYTSDGFHDPDEPNYIVGRYDVDYRNFFVFDLSSVTGTITSATLKLFNPSDRPGSGYLSPDATETLELYDVSTSIASLTDGTTGVSAFTDLGSGTSFGSTIVSVADNGTFITITLNASALSALNVAGGLFAIGGAVTTLSGPDFQYVFGNSDLNPGTTLELETTTALPTPGTLALFGISFMSMLVNLRRRKKPEEAS
jgi:hypothetical protein